MASTIYNFEASLKDLNTIEAACNKNYDSPSMRNMRLYEDGKFINFLRFVSRSESKSTYIYTFALTYSIVPGRHYELSDGRGESTPLDISLLAGLKKFEEKYRYDGELGAIYSPDSTVFRVFSPLASEMLVKLVSPDGDITYQNMHRLESGVYEKKVEGDLDEWKYVYIGRVNGKYVQAVDPYAKGLTTNSRYGYVVNLAKLEKIDLNLDKLPPLKSACNAVIYELDVRDMTSLTGLKGKGTYNLLAKEGLKDSKGNAIGLDYIANLGVSHVQLLPVFDFSTIPEDYPESSYNWGYDPLFYFAPEGSYSSEPEDCYTRLFELRKLVAAFHSKGIRVNMDVVFNHTFQVKTNSFEILCPNYYYRRNEDGTLSNGSGCGNDLETRNYMVRKLIVDCCKYFVTYYGMDGFRFDLMGIIDRKTMELVVYNIKGLKHEAMIYGEGWDMMTPLPSDEKTSLNNALYISDIGFFNDRFRDVSRGHSYGGNLTPRGYLTGDPNYIDGYKHVYLGSVASLAFPPLFNRPSQSINYVECHDDACLYDKLKTQYPDVDESVLLRRIKMINACTVLAMGVPFIHAGQEVGHSKKGNTNSYDAGDIINGFDYAQAYRREDMIEYLKGVIQLKKSYPELSLDNKKSISEQVEFENLANGGLAVKYYKNGSVDVVVFINPSESMITYELPKYYKVIFNEAGLISKMESYAQLVIINGLSVVVCKA